MTFIGCRWCYSGGDRWWRGEGTCWSQSCYRYRDGVSDKLAEVPCDPGDGGGMAVREFGVSLSGRGGAAQL